MGRNPRNRGVVARLQGRGDVASGETVTTGRGDMADKLTQRRILRRTQEERSTETRSRLLAATIDLLIEVGYARLSTNDVATRAGLSRGAQVHHFPLKADLVRAAIEDLAKRYSAFLLAKMESLPEGKTGTRIALNTLWEIYSSPLHDAYLELRVAGRTDPDVRRVEKEMLEAVVWPTHRKFMEALVGAVIHKDKALREKVEAAVVFVRTVADARSDLGDAWCERQLRVLAEWLTPIVQETRQRSAELDARRGAPRKRARGGRP